MVLRAEGGASGGGASGGGVTFDGARMMGWGAIRPANARPWSPTSSGKCTHHFKLLTPGTLTLRQTHRPGKHPGKTGAAHYLFEVTAQRRHPATTRSRSLTAVRSHEERFDESVPNFEEARRAAEADHARWQAKRPAIDGSSP